MSMNFFSLGAWIAKGYLMLLLVVVLVAGCGKQKNTPLAETYFKMAFLELSEQPDQPGAIKRALAHCDQALQQEKKAEFYALKATLLFKLGDFSASRQAYQQALALHPDQPVRAEIENNYACLLAQMGQGAAAQQMWRLLTENVSYQTPEVAWVNLGRSYATEQNLIQAKHALEQAVVLEPSYLDAHYYLAVVAQRLGDVVLARQQADLVLATAPEHTGAAALARQLGNG